MNPNIALISPPAFWAATRCAHIPQHQVKKAFSPVLLAFCLVFRGALLVLILLHSDDDVADEHDVSHDRSQRAGKRGVAWMVGLVLRCLPREVMGKYP